MAPVETPHEPRAFAVPSHPKRCAETPETPVQRTLNAPRIILAEDQPVVLMAADMALPHSSSHGLTIVAQAHSADELIDHLERTPCDILISDYAMPDGDFPNGRVLMDYVRSHFCRGCRT